MKTKPTKLSRRMRAKADRLVGLAMKQSPAKEGAVVAYLRRKGVPQDMGKAQKVARSFHPEGLTDLTWPKFEGKGSARAYARAEILAQGW